MAVLLQFNTETSWTLLQLHEFTSIPMDMLKQVRSVPVRYPAAKILCLWSSHARSFNVRSLAWSGELLSLDCSAEWCLIWDLVIDVPRAQYYHPSFVYPEGSVFYSSYFLR